MAHREDIEERKLHDRAINDIAQNGVLFPSYGEVITNLGSEKNRDVGGLYPDIIFIDRRTGLEFMIGEVETESSVNEDEAINQWLRYAKLNIHFYLFVPDTCMAEAFDLVKRYNIKADIHMYHYRFGFLQLV